MSNKSIIHKVKIGKQRHISMIDSVKEKKNPHSKSIVDLKVTSSCFFKTSVKNMTQLYPQNSTIDMKSLLIPKRKIIREPYFIRKLGLNIDSIHNEELPVFSFPIPPLPQFAELPKIKTPSDNLYCNLTRNAIQKIISHFTTPNKNINLVYKLVKKLKFFQRYPEETCLKILKISEYLYFSQGETIFKEGDFADSLYIILEGSISIQQESQTIPFVISSKYDGETVGEFSISRGNVDETESKRTATCLAGESTHLLKLLSKEYQEILSELNANENNIIEFLRSIVIFKHILPVDLAFLSNNIQPIKYYFDEVVLDYGEVPKGLYIILKGRIKAIYRKHEIQYPPKYFFGQRVIVGESTKSRCKIVSNDVNTVLILILPHHFELIYPSLREITMSILARFIQNDL